MNDRVQRPRVLLLMTPTTYRAADFLGAAEAAGVDIVVGTNRAQTLAGLAPDHNLTLPFADSGREAARCARAYAARCPVDAVVGVDDEAVLPAARVAAALGDPAQPGRRQWSPPAARWRSARRWPQQDWPRPRSWRPGTVLDARPEVGRCRSVSPVWSSRLPSPAAVVSCGSTGKRTWPGSGSGSGAIVEEARQEARQGIEG